VKSLVEWINFSWLSCHFLCLGPFVSAYSFACRPLSMKIFFRFMWCSCLWHVCLSLRVWMSFCLLDSVLSWWLDREQREPLWGSYVAFSVVSPCFNIRPGGLGNFRNSLYFSVLSWLYPGAGAHSLPSWYWCWVRERFWGSYPTNKGSFEPFGSGSSFWNSCSWL